MKPEQTNKITALILDMDGVLWRSDQAVVNLPEAFDMIRRRGFGCILVTNNSTQTADQYLEKLAAFDVHLERWQVMTSSEATAEYMKKLYPEGGPVYIVGEEGLVKALEEKGFCLEIEKPLAVVAGLDRRLTYEKLETATLLIRDGCSFIATNPDRTLPTPRGFVPGAGAVLAAIEAASDVSPHVVGKPAAEMFYIALDRLNAKAEETMMIGDRLETDIAGAQAVGCKTGLVLTGVSSREDAESWQPKPDIIAPDLIQLLARI